LLSSDVIIIGAGAAGLMCALTAGQRGQSVLLVDHANKVAKKILMSGGGRCNFTNLYCDDENYLSHNPHFCKSALSRFTQWDFIAMVEKHGIAYHEKKQGQLFCDNKASEIVKMLVEEVQAAGVSIRKRCQISEIKPKDEGFILKSDIGEMTCKSLVIATGGLSIPTIGASGFGYEIAKQFGIRVLDTRPALVPFVFSQKLQNQFAGLAGISTDVQVSTNGQYFSDSLLFTHKGLSGPAILQISSYWNYGDTVEINFFPELDILQYLKEQQQLHPKIGLVRLLSEYLPKKLVQNLTAFWGLDKKLTEYKHTELAEIAEQFTHWRFVPAGTEGYRTAEVTLGGIDPDELSSQTMESKSVKGLYFIGEVIDVTGHLGGFNFQWAWASGSAAGAYV